MLRSALTCFFFFFNDTATTEIYTLSLHDALPIYLNHGVAAVDVELGVIGVVLHLRDDHLRSEEHTSELQSQSNLVCRLLLEKKKTESADRESRDHSRFRPAPSYRPPSRPRPRERA